MAVRTDPSLPSVSTILRTTALTASYKRKDSSYTYTAVVTDTDQNKRAISGASVSLEWTLPDGTPVPQTGTTSGSGTVSFSVSADARG